MNDYIKLGILILSIAGLFAIIHALPGGVEGDYRGDYGTDSGYLE